MKNSIPSPHCDHQGDSCSGIEYGGAAAYALMRRACRQAWQRGLLSGFNGNVSLRCAGHELVENVCAPRVSMPNTPQGTPPFPLPYCHITCTGAAKGYLRPEDVALVDSQGQVLGGGHPSSEMPMHLAIYNSVPEARAIVHCHPRHLLALELKVGLDDFLCLPLFEADMLRARLGLAAALPPGSRRLAEAVADAALHADAVWMSRHGLTCRAADLATAVALAEELDHMAAIQLLLV